MVSGVNYTLIPLIFYKNAVLVHSYKRFSNIHTKNIYNYQKKSIEKRLTINMFCAIIITRNNVTHIKEHSSDISFRD